MGTAAAAPPSPGLVQWPPPGVACAPGEGTNDGMRSRGDRLPAPACDAACCARSAWHSDGTGDRDGQSLPQAGASPPPKDLRARVSLGALLRLEEENRPIASAAEAPSCGAVWTGVRPRGRYARTNEQDDLNLSGNWRGLGGAGKQRGVKLRCLFCAACCASWPGLSFCAIVSKLEQQ